MWWPGGEDVMKLARSVKVNMCRDDSQRVGVHTENTNFQRQALDGSKSLISQRNQISAVAAGSHEALSVILMMPPHHPWHQVDSFCYCFGWHRYITTPTHHNFQFHPWASIFKDVCIIIHRLLHQGPGADSGVQLVHIQYGSTTTLPMLLINRW